MSRKKILYGFIGLGSLICWIIYNPITSIHILFGAKERDEKKEDEMDDEADE